MSQSSKSQVQDRIDLGQQKQAARAASSQAQREAATTQKRRENPQFVEQLRDLGLPDEEIEGLQWMRSELGPLTAGAHATANRSAQHERRIQWGLFAEAEQMICEREPGRLCDDGLREIASGTHGRPDATALEPASPEEKRHLRNAMKAVKSLQSLGVGAEGLRALTEATVVNRTEKMEEEESSLREKAAGALS